MPMNLSQAGMPKMTHLRFGWCRKICLANQAPRKGPGSRNVVQMSLAGVVTMAWPLRRAMR